LAVLVAPLRRARPVRRGILGVALPGAAAELCAVEDVVAGRFVPGGVGLARSKPLLRRQSEALIRDPLALSAPAVLRERERDLEAGEAHVRPEMKTRCCPQASGPVTSRMSPSSTSRSSNASALNVFPYGTSLRALNAWNAPACSRRRNALS